MKYENAKKNAEEIEKIVNKDLGKIIKNFKKDRKSFVKHISMVLYNIK